MLFMRKPLAQGLFYGIFWTAGMAWWSWPLGRVELAILAVCGLLAGAAFGWFTGKYFAWIERRQNRTDQL